MRAIVFHLLLMMPLKAFAAEPVSIPPKLLECIIATERSQKSVVANKTDDLQNALTRLRLMLPLSDLPSLTAISQTPCLVTDDLETTSRCEYGLFDKSHSGFTVFNRYSIGPFQIRPSIALRMESFAASRDNRAPREPRKVLEDLLDEATARSSAEAYLAFLEKNVRARYPNSQASTRTRLGVWATWYNEGQIRYRIEQHKDKILTRVNRFGRSVERCATRSQARQINLIAVD